MKKIIPIIVLSLALVVSLTACGGASEAIEELNQQKEKLEEVGKEISSGVEAASKELESASEALSSGLEVASQELESASQVLESASQELDKASGQFSGLTDKELVLGVYGSLQAPDNYKMLVENINNGSKMINLTCVNGDSYKVGNDFGDGNGMTYTIYNAEENMTYMYQEATKTGTKMQGSMGMQEPSKHEFSTKGLDDEYFNTLEEAKIENYEGKECLYTRTKKEFNGKMMTYEMWLSIPDREMLLLRTTDADGNILGEMITKEVEVDKDFSSEMVPPEDIVFNE